MSTHDPVDSTAAPTAPPSLPARKGWQLPALLVAGAALLLGVGQLLFWHAGAQINKVALNAAPKRATVVATRAAQYRPRRRYVGTLAPWIEASVGPQIVTAYVSTVLVRPGAAVKRGDVLATLDCREASATSKAVAEQARALEARQAALAAQASRMGNLLSEGFVAPNELELRRAESNTEQARLLAARAQLLGSSLAVNDCVLRAPFDGEIADRNIDPGAFVRPGSSVVSVVDRNVIRVVADVPETDFDAVGPGTPIQIKFLATGLATSGTISRRSPAADPATRTIHVEADLPNPDRSIPVNTTAELLVEVGQPVRAIALPLTAADVRGARANVVVVDRGVAHLRTLHVLGEREGSLFLEPELSAGAQVVTEGRGMLAEGDHVTAKPETPSTSEAQRPDASGKSG
jgi:RND family efflux transporter MFP subunit